VNELERIALLRSHLEAGMQPGVTVGIGDDAAVLAEGQGSLVWTVDAQVDGTHFRIDWASWEDVGWRSFMAAASDLAAMGARPSAALSSLVLAPSVTDGDLEAFARGQAAAARAVGAPVVGGNLARGQETSITTTLLGRTYKPVLRRGARAGEGVFLAGAVGLAAAGLGALLAGDRRLLHDARIAPALAAWRRPHARTSDADTVARAASAAVDVSDGLARDASHVGEASDVRLVLEASFLLEHGGDVLHAAAQALGRDPLDLALHGGEDYALLATSAEAELPGFMRIGRVEAADGASSRIVVEVDGATLGIDPLGFDHFASPRPDERP